MKKNRDSNFYDVTAHLVERFGPVGSKTWKAEEDKAWEEYNGEILRDARKEAGLTGWNTTPSKSFATERLR